MKLKKRRQSFSLPLFFLPGSPPSSILPLSSVLYVGGERMFPDEIGYWIWMLLEGRKKPLNGLGKGEIWRDSSRFGLSKRESWDSSEVLLLDSMTTPKISFAGTLVFLPCHENVILKLSDSEVLELGWSQITDRHRREPSLQPGLLSSRSHMNPTP